MFHDVRRISETILAEVRENYADLIPLADALRPHYEAQYADYRNKKHLDAKIDAAVHIVLATLIATDRADAIARVAAERQIQPISVPASIAKALTDALPHTALFADGLHEKGFLHVRDRFFVLGQDLEKGSDFHGLCRLAQAKYPDAVEETLYRALSNKNTATSATHPFGPSMLPYIMLRLATSGETQGPFMENKVTFGVHAQTFQRNEARAEPAIRQLEEKFAIVIPGFSTPSSTTPTPHVKVGAVPASHSAVPLYAPALPINTIPEQRDGWPASNLEDKKRLARTLHAIIKTEHYGVSEQDAKIYLAFRRIPKRVVNPAAFLTSRFNLSPENVQAAYDRVTLALAEKTQGKGIGDQTEISIKRAPSVHKSAARTSRSG